MSTPEGRVKDAVKRVLKAADKCYYYMPVQNGMGARSLDFVGCSHGRFFAIETKAPKKEPTQFQQMTIREMAEAGATVFVINDADRKGEQLAHLADWLENV